MSGRDESYSPFNGPLPRPTPAPIERVWRLRRGQDGADCQLRDRSPHGIEAQVFGNAQLVSARLFPSRASALAWAEAERAARRKAGFEAV